MMDDSYEQKNWARLSPKFRDEHNRRRIANGLSPIPAPVVDLYIGPMTLSAEDRKRFEIPSSLDIYSLPPGAMLPPIGKDEGTTDGRRI